MANVRDTVDVVVSVHYCIDRDSRHMPGPFNYLVIVLKPNQGVIFTISEKEKL